MTYRISILPKAVRQLSRVPKPERARLLRRIDALADDPRPADVKKLQGPESLYRIRSGHYRIIYMINDREVSVLIVRVGHRRDVYRGL